MADTNSRHPLNVLGAWFVDDECINCSVCTELAPDVFGRDDEGYSYVKMQIQDNPEQAELFRDALDDCPVEAIGDTEDPSTLS
jgi:ferredoxin